MNRVTLLIGGNEGDRELLIDQATEQIRERIGSVVALSRVYETEPWGEFEVNSEQLTVNSFLNRGMAVETTLSPWQVLRTALTIEKDLGRQRPHLSPFTSHLSPRIYHSRPMDIDLIFYDDLVLDTPELTLPHPRMHLRRFVLEPLAEIMPDYRHPVTGKTVQEMLDGCPATPSGFSKDGGAECAGVALRPTPACNLTPRKRGLPAEPPQGVNATQAGDLSPVKEDRENVEPPQGVNGTQAGVITPAKGTNNNNLNP